MFFYSYKKGLPMKKTALLVSICLSLTLAACGTSDTQETKNNNIHEEITQRLKGDYTISNGKKETLTSEQMNKMLKGESVRLKDNTEVKLSKEQIENNENLTKYDISNLLKNGSKK